MKNLAFITIISTNFLIFLISNSATLNTITPSQSLRDGDTLVSSGRIFELGFFSPGTSKNRFLGIWYKNIPVRTIVWVANRQIPINGSSGLLVVNSTGSLLLSQNRTIVWSSGLRRQAQRPVVELFDSGNLVIRDGSNSDDYLWQSFDYPSDTLLPGMKLGWDLKTGLNRHLSAWNNPNDPSPGDFTWGVELENSPEILMWKGSQKFNRDGPWNGIGFSGAPELKPNPVFDYSFIVNNDEVYFIYHLKDNSSFTRIVLNQTHYLRQRYSWSNDSKSWMMYAVAPRDYCDNYGLCGPNGECVIRDSPGCQCFQGFWSNSTSHLDWSKGCVRKTPLNCSRGDDGFIKFSGLQLPDSTNSWVNSSMNLKECRAKCLRNCSCTAYTNSDIRYGGSGCILWFGNLIDIREFSSSGQDLYIRLSAADIGVPDKRHRILMAVTIPIIMAAFIGVILISYYICRTRARSKESALSIWKQDKSYDHQAEDLELPLFDLCTIAKVTDNFAQHNKLGEGGFGPVYKGRLADGQEIAVKRLSISSGQGLKEFKNEVILIAKLQHRNLVRLLGCCIQGEEKMLVYEYMPNKSLDFFIFDEARAKLLEWPKRFNIICGIARGLLYLHQDSRLRIIHRDLKASNVLLDHDLNPKISDFGIARTFRGDQGEGNTNRVVGTFGYMAPEYAIEGLFSVKSDVFSFGILMMEIISGIKNRGFYHPSHSHNLMEHAWILWKAGKHSELVDSWLKESCSVEVTRCIHVSLLCVQQFPEDRPNMSSVVLMLGGESALPEPKQPGFFTNKKSLVDANSSTSKRHFYSTNKVTITFLEPR